MTRPRFAFHTWPAAVYAIGDIHGCLQQLLDLESQIVADGMDIEGEKWIVTLGDHIDRGPASRQVVDHVLGTAPPGFRRFSLQGNHEQMMLEFVEDPLANSYWLDEGGTETLASYGFVFPAGEPAEAALPALAARIDTLVPPAHRAWLREAAGYLALPGWVFVHAGIRPGIPLAQQTDEDLVWIRAPFLSAQLTGGLRVVHGHTPGPDIVVTPHRIDLDTHCFATGRLSAVRVTPDGETRFLQVVGPSAR
jgi:serine/threonine protein phosphatase 1